jgi:hypothetical protein
MQCSIQGLGCLPPQRQKLSSASAAGRVGEPGGACSRCERNARSEGILTGNVSRGHEGSTLLLGLVVLFFLPPAVGLGIAASPWLGLVFGGALIAIAVGVPLANHLRVPRLLVAAFGLIGVIASATVLLMR